MNRKYLWPAAIAFALHLLLLGFRPPTESKSAPPTDDDPTTTTIFVLPPEEPPMVEPFATAGGGGGDPSDTAALPEIPEPVTTSRVDGITITVPDRLELRPDHGLTRVPPGVGWRGLGEGDGPGLAAGLWDPDQLDAVPRTKFQAKPVYPFEAKRNGIEGAVTVAFIVDETGQVRDAHAVATDHPAFAEPAVRAVLRWRFERGMKNGRPVRFRMTVPLVFRLNE